jgi:endogenous inhibitor of DNA gyrase (YacG/DUF329 family)
VSDTCPICHKARGARPENKAWPFCSERCRLADLGKWLGEEYRIPVIETDGVEADEDDGETKH